MTFLEQLQAHEGGLVRLKTELYWYDGRGYDNTPGRICLILDAATAARSIVEAASATAATAAATTAAAARDYARGAARAYLLIDGRPQWIWIVEKDVELL